MKAFPTGLHHADYNVTISGVGGEKLVIDLYGILPYFGSVWLHDKVVTNILSFGEFETKYDIRCEQMKAFHRHEQRSKVPDQENRHA